MELTTERGVRSWISFLDQLCEKASPRPQTTWELSADRIKRKTGTVLEMGPPDGSTTDKEADMAVHLAKSPSGQSWSGYALSKEITNSALL